MANVLERALRMGEGRILRRLKSYADAVNHLEDDFKTLSDDDLKHETVELRERYGLPFHKWVHTLQLANPQETQALFR